MRHLFALLSIGLAFDMAGGAVGAATAEDAKVVIARVLARLQDACDPAVEAQARARIKTDPQDPIGRAMLGAYHACRSRRPEGLAPAPAGRPVRWAGDELGRAVDELRRAVDAYPTLHLAVALFMRVMGDQALSGEILKYVKSLPVEAFNPDVLRELMEALAKLPARNEGDGALAVADALIARFPEREDVRHAAAATWLDAGRLDAGRAAVEAWLARDPACPTCIVLAAQGDIVAGTTEAGLARLEPLAADARAKLWLELGRFATGRGPSAARLRAVRGEGADLAAKAVDDALAKAEADRGPRLTEAGKLTLDTRRFTELALLLAARRRAGSWGDAEQLLHADLYRRLREWRREAETLKPLEAKVDAQGRTDTGVSAGDFHFRIGRALFHAARLADAERQFALASKAGKDDAELDFHIAKNLAEQGRRDEAVAMMKKAAQSPRPGQHAHKARSQLAKEGSPAPGAIPTTSTPPAPSPAPSAR